jgi:hypothetical protein
LASDPANAHTPCRLDEVDQLSLELGRGGTTKTLKLLGWFALLINQVKEFETVQGARRKG